LLLLDGEAGIEDNGRQQVPVASVRLCTISCIAL
jgi:hypothetical protein